MRKILLSIILFVTCFSVNAQKIKHFDSFLKLTDMSTRYVAVLEDNSIWWYSPEQFWKKSSHTGLPEGYDIKHFSAYSKLDGTTRYVCVLNDNTIWWFSSEAANWIKSSSEGLPAGYSIKFFNAFSKEDGARYVVVLEDNRIYWFTPNQGWKLGSLQGLPND